MFEVGGLFIMCPKERDLLFDPVTEGPLIQYLRRMSPMTEDWPEIDDPKPEIEPEAVSGTSRRSDEDPQDKGC